VRRIRPALGALLLTMATSQTVAAQAPAEPRGFVAVRGGLNVERAEDDLRGESPAVGAAAGFWFADDWIAEFEFWYPGFIEDGSTRHRDVLFGVNAQRSFGTGSLRPRLMVGVTAARTQDELTFCLGPPTSTTGPTLLSCSDPAATSEVVDTFSSISVFGLGGAALAYALGARVHVVGDVRIDFAVTTVIVRPAVSLAIVF
jgi:hypothetical protein